MDNKPVYEEVTLEDIEEYRRTGKFSKNVDKYDEMIVKAGIINGGTNQEILEAINF